MDRVHRKMQDAMFPKRAPGTSAPFAAGEEVTWMREQRGGYGFLIPFHAVVEKETNKRVRIRLAKSGRVVSVRPESLRRREPVPAPMADAEGR